ncbi:MAG: arsenate reductase ArsC [Syntrophaceae bacterium]|nr:arsenate reductase ArsC [Syntrophaceae bacterium]
MGNLAKSKVLFICVYNSARSQMAEAWLNHLCGDFFEAESAGLEPGNLLPMAIEVMKEMGIDISHKKTRSVFDLVKAGRIFSYVITVCDEASAERCPIFPGIAKRLHWSFPDPAAVTGTGEEKLEKVRKIRDDIKSAIEAWCNEMKTKKSSDS